ncbi:phosphatidylglycerophosphatase A [Halocynthiibacter namhaensis]|uniref:phosphatidylglycerophosphatase A family protein n=1 Tax=Halocynthiibacter namhaensis TaxID=1290553 RepID=UPI000578E85D|nr:phosphatidylglycerophosphatase A [Halocynthiibacter namhaensis]
MQKFIARSIAVFFGAGLIRPAPGTWGSLAAIPAGLGLHVLGGPVLLAIGACVAFFVGWWATLVSTHGQDDHDPSEIVIDEVAGQWIALIPVAIGATHSGASILALWPGILTAFAAFRFFDILKPGPVGMADRRHDAFGVMLDDVIAGILAAFVVMGAAWISHGLIGV